MKKLILAITLILSASTIACGGGEEETSCFYSERVYMCCTTYCDYNGRNCSTFCK